MFELPAIDISTKTRSSRRPVALRGRGHRRAAARHPRLRAHRAGQRRSPSPSASGSAAPTSSPRRPASPTRPSPIARTLSDSFAGIKPSSAPMFIVMQLIGAAHRVGPDPLPLPPERSPMPDHIPEVLFVCVHNAGRSQMAAALLDTTPRAASIVRSAGTAPADEHQPGRRRGDGRDRHRPPRRAAPPQDPHRGRRPGRPTSSSPWAAATPAPYYPGTRYLDWAARRPRRQDARRDPAHPRRDRPLRPRTSRRAHRTRKVRHDRPTSAA